VSGDPTDVDQLRRWQDSGALWRVLWRDEHRVTVGLFTCDGGEEVHRLTSEDPALLRFVAGRDSSEA
jgi:hypothetical protein